MKFENTQVMNFKNAIKGMRNPKNSWDKSDSYFGIIDSGWTDEDFQVASKWMKKYYSELCNQHDGYNEEYEEHFQNYDQWLIENGVLQQCENNGDLLEVAFIGPKDMKLAQTLIHSGPEHRKFLRQIFVSVDITAPLYLWKELDTYKVGTTANSTSTMHKITSKPITLDCFETDDCIIDLELPNNFTSEDKIQFIIDFCEELRQKYLETKDKRYWKELIRWLPESWLQTRTWTANYETILSICHQRKNHKLTEWHSFVDWARTLPYAQEFLFFDESSEQVL